jgi:hypothetical protein
MIPTPHSALLKTKAKAPFDKTVKRLLRPFFPFFKDSIRFNFSPVFPFLLFGQQRVAKWTGLGFLANCQLPIASC